MCSETSSPRFSFSNDVSPMKHDVVPRKDTLLLESNSDFEFITSRSIEFETSSADELFSNGVILPLQIHDKKNNTTSYKEQPRYMNLPPRPFSTKTKKETINREVQETKNTQSSSFLGFKRSKSLNCDTNKGIVCFSPPLSRSNSTGSALNLKGMSSNRQQSSYSTLNNLYPMQKSSSGLHHSSSMDMETDEGINSIKDIRQQLEARIGTQHKSHMDMLSSVQSVIPNLVSSLDLSLKVLSSFNQRPFAPTPALHPPLTNFNPPKSSLQQLPENPSNNNNNSQNPKTSLVTANPESEKVSPLSIVRSMVAVYLLSRVPFSSIDSSTVLRKLENDQTVTPQDKAALQELGGELGGPTLAVEIALRSMADDNGAVELDEFVVSGKSRIMVSSIDRTRLLRELPETAQHLQQQNESSLGDGNTNQNQQQIVTANANVNGAMGAMGRPVLGPTDMWMSHVDHHMSELQQGVAGLIGIVPAHRGIGISPMHTLPLVPNASGSSINAVLQKRKTYDEDLKYCEALINKKSYMELQKSKTAMEFLELITKLTARETAVAAKYKTKGGPQVMQYCDSVTKENCRHQTGSFIACNKYHYRRIIALHTDITLGACPYLKSCRHMKTCKCVHYELDPTPDLPPTMMSAPPPKPLKQQRAEYCSEVELGEPQWINCDIRNFRMDILGKFGVIMADPPWDIHMELPYGTMADDEMRTLNVPALQTDGLIFLWVTGRAMELGRECLELWGYKCVEEIIWVKTNQLQRIIRTGRTGHWLNHSKEHCLVGIKGSPEVNKNIDTDVIVAEVRETSRKPDEMYALLERISPRTRKLELFARMHNTHAGWMSLGNQLGGVRLVDEGLRARFKAAYPDVEVQPASPPRASSVAAQTRSPFASTESKVH